MAQRLELGHLGGDILAQTRHPGAVVNEAVHGSQQAVEGVEAIGVWLDLLGQIQAQLRILDLTEAALGHSGQLVLGAEELVLETGLLFVGAPEVRGHSLLPGCPCRGPWRQQAHLPGATIHSGSVTRYR